MSDSWTTFSDDDNALKRVGEQPAPISYLSPDIAWAGTKPPMSPDEAWTKAKEYSGYTDVKEGLNQLGEGNYLGGAAQTAFGAANAAGFLPGKALLGAKVVAEAAPLAAIGGMFYGKGATGADALARARAMFQENVLGKHPEAIRQSTGWFKGPEGVWRFEGSDDAAKFTLDKYSDALDKIDYEPRLSDILQHDELYRQMPDVANIKVHHNNMTGTSASYYPHDDTIGIDPKLLDPYSTDPEMTRSILLHEIQHAIENREGFARGGNPREFLPPNYSDLTKEKQDTADAIYDIAKSRGIPRREVGLMLEDIEYGDKLPKDFPRFERELELYKSHQDKLNDAHDLANEMYYRLAGEVQARLTQARMNLTAEQRQRITPFNSTIQGARNPYGADFPASQQIVLGNDEQVLMPPAFSSGTMPPGVEHLGGKNPNFVVKDPKLLDTIKKYGIPALLASGYPLGNYLIPVDYTPQFETAIP